LEVKQEKTLSDEYDYRWFVAMSMSRRASKTLLQKGYIVPAIDLAT
jgi:hypothetical protein